MLWSTWWKKQKYFKILEKQYYLYFLECSAGAVEMMGESSLTFIPLDDPEKKVLILSIFSKLKWNIIPKSLSVGQKIIRTNVFKVAEEVIEKGYDSSDIAKVKGNG